MSFLIPTFTAELFRDVAQPGRVHVWGAWSRKFKSCHPDWNTAAVGQHYFLRAC